MVTVAVVPARDRLQTVTYRMIHLEHHNHDYPPGMFRRVQPNTSPLRQPQHLSAARPPHRDG